MEEIFMEETILLDTFKQVFFTFLKDNSRLVKFIVFVFIAVSIFRIFKPKIKGKLGEENIRRKLNKLPKEYRVLNDIMVKTEDKTSQIDHIVLSIYGIFVIETKMYSGWIYGKENSKNWTENIYGKKYKFLNPFIQNKGHIKSLKNLGEDFEDKKYISIVAFSPDADLKNKENMENLIYFREINKTIKKYTEVLYTEEEIDLLKEYIESENIVDRKSRKKHIRDIKENYI